MSKHYKIGLIGAGNMNRAILGGLIESGFEGTNIIVSNPSPEPLAALREQYGIKTTQINAQAADFAEVLLLGVKPYQISTVCNDIKASIRKHLIISVAAGIPTGQIENRLHPEVALVRAMPNTPCLYGQGAIGLFANNNVSNDQRLITEHIFSGIGTLEWFTEQSQMDLVTAISGSGPAYFFYLAEGMIQAAVDRGMDPKQASNLVHQTALGAAQMLTSSGQSAAQLRRAVTSAGGTTAAALTVFEQTKGKDIIAKAVMAAEQRGKEMAQENE